MGDPSVVSVGQRKGGLEHVTAASWLPGSPGGESVVRVVLLDLLGDGLDSARILRLRKGSS